VKTDDLIGMIVAEVRPVRRLRSPAHRVALWLAVTLPCVAVVVLIMTPRPDLAQKLADPRFQTEQLAAFATALAAAFAAFSAVIPGRSRWILLRPVVPLAAWLASLGQDCARILLIAGPEGLRLGWDWVCIPAIAMVGTVPAFAIVVMLRRGAPVLPCTAVALGALAAAALGNFGLRLFHTQDASLVVLVWQFGTVALLSVLAGLAGRHILTWPHMKAKRWTGCDTAGHGGGR
jgi:hypothetical protein